MYGFLRPPITASQYELREYKKYMCTLCDSLHENHGIKGRLFTNYDSTALAFLIGALDKSLDDELDGPPKYLCLRPVKHKKAPNIFKFISEVTIMLAYTKFLDNSIEKNGHVRVPKWINKQSVLADAYLSKYGLGKSYFESILQEQHRLEKNHANIDDLSAPTAEIISKILSISCELTDKMEYTESFKNLGYEVGKLIYICDGLLDYHTDLKNGSFNCIHGCYVGRNSNIKQVSDEVYYFINNLQSTISLMLNKIEFTKDTKFLEKILFQDIAVKERNGRRKNILNKSFCESYHNRLTSAAIYGILAGTLLTQTAAATDGSEYPGLGVFLGGPGGCCLLMGVCCIYEKFFKKKNK